MLNGAGDRRRNAAGTRDAILDAARIAFTRYGFDQIGIREITHSVGVNGSLVNRYFGSKEMLFAEVMSLGMGFETLDLTWPQAVEAMATFVLDKDGVDRHVFDPVLTIIRSASNVAAQPVLREYLLREAITPLTALIGGEDAEARASLIVAFLLGVVFLRSVMHFEPLTAAKRADLAARLEAIILAAADRDGSKPSNS